MELIDVKCAFCEIYLCHFAAERLYCTRSMLEQRKCLLWGNEDNLFFPFMLWLVACVKGRLYFLVNVREWRRGRYCQGFTDLEKQAVNLPKANTDAA